MRRLFIAAALSLCLAACSAGTVASVADSIPTAPQAAADKVVLDEQAALGVELAYQGARSLVELAVDAGFVKGERALKVATLDERAYQAVLAARAAYRAGNAASYSAALAEARKAISAVVSTVKGT